MANINIVFNGINYLIDESSLATATSNLRSHLLTVMNGSGAVINLDGDSYDVDASKLSTATRSLVSHLGTIAGNDTKIVVGGAEYFIDDAKVGNTTSILENYLGNLNIPSIADLENKYQFVYFSTLGNAVNAVNNNTIDNYDADKETAAAGVYIDENENINVVLLKDVEEKVSVASNMTINLGGHTLSSTVGSALMINSGKVHVDGRIDGSTIIANAPDGVSPRAIAINTNGDVSVEGGTYIGSGTNKASTAILCLGKLTINNATAIGRTTAAFTHGISMSSSSSSANITNCKIYIYADKGENDGVHVQEAYAVTISDSEIKTYSHYKSKTNTDTGTNHYSVSATGIKQSGTGVVTLNNCYVMGTHSGVETCGTLYVNGGIYEGYGHGGFYVQGRNATTYIRNAIIRECDMPEGYETDIYSNRTGAYFGYNNGITVYVDNCGFVGQTWPFVIKGGSEATTVYVSNSTIDGGSIRIDTDSHRLYIGAGNNFTAENTQRPTSVITTDETYIMS